MKAKCKACGEYFPMEDGTDQSFPPDFCDDCEDQGYTTDEEIYDFSDADSGL